MHTKGADKLVGKGDMLYLPPGSAKLERAQGAFVTDAEIERLIDHCALQAKPQFEKEIQATINGENGDELLGVCFLRDASERAIGSDRRAGKRERRN